MCERRSCGTPVLLFNLVGGRVFIYPPLTFLYIGQSAQVVAPIHTTTFFGEATPAAVLSLSSEESFHTKCLPVHELIFILFTTQADNY